MLLNGIYVVTTIWEGRCSGLAVAWATQVEREHLLVSLGSESFTCRQILASRVFALSQLHLGQSDLARSFGLRSSADADKFAGVETETWGTGAPLLADRLQGFECAVVDARDLGGQVLLTGRVLRSERPRTGVEPMTYVAADYYEGKG